MAFWADDKDHSKPNLQVAWELERATLGLHYMAGCYSADHLLDGFVPEHFVEQKLPRRRERERTIDALVSAGMWIRRADGFEIVGYLELNPSRDRVEADRERKRAAGRAGGRARARRGRQADA
jgi:hypothetical protein